MNSDSPTGDGSAPPGGLKHYRTTDIFTESSIPPGLLREHNTKPGVWAVVCVLDGALEFTRHVPLAKFLLRAGDRHACPPEVVHSVAPRGVVRFQVEFWR